MNKNEMAMIRMLTMMDEPSRPQRRKQESKPRGLTGKQWTSRKSNQNMAKASKKNNRR